MESKLMAHFYNPKLMDFLLVCRLLLLFICFAHFICVRLSLFLSPPSLSLTVCFYDAACEMRQTTLANKNASLFNHFCSFVGWWLREWAEQGFFLLFHFSAIPSPVSFRLPWTHFDANLMGRETEWIAVLCFGWMFNVSTAIRLARQSI